MTKGILETMKTNKNLNIDVTDHENEYIKKYSKAPDKVCCWYFIALGQTEVKPPH